MAAHIRALDARHYDFAGVRVRLESDSAAALEALQRDFSLFAAPFAPEALAWRLDLRRGTAVRRPGPGRPWAAWSEGTTRRVVYDDGATAWFDRARGLGAAASEDPLRLQETAHLAILAAVGEELDRRGLHRVHALGFERGGGAGLLLLPSGGGKSELALSLLMSRRARLLSEDTPLLDASGTVRPFPVRLSFRAGADLTGVPAERVRAYRRRRWGERRLVDADYFKDRVSGPVPLRWILIGEKADGRAARVRAASRADALAALGSALVVGVGVPQMAEWRLRLDASCAAGLVRACVSRLATACAAAARARTHRFRLSRSPAESAAALDAWLTSEGA